MLAVRASARAVFEDFYARGWTDGLPIIPPTDVEVRAMLGGTTLSQDAVVAHIPPSEAPATVEKLAINAVMAGCRPEYLPVLIAAVQAATEKQVELLSVQATTHPCAPLVIVNGPVRQRIQMNCKGNAFGQGWMANATIGRAMRFVLVNIGGGVPGPVDRCTLGQPSKYTFCVGENEEDSPWEPLHVERGYPKDTDVVTVTVSENPHNINDHASATAADLLKTIAGSMTGAGTNDTRHGRGKPVVVIGPEHAAMLAREGMSKHDVKQALFEGSKLDLRWMSLPNMASERRPRPDQADQRVPLVESPDDIVLIVLGGPGRHSAFLPSFGHNGIASRRVES